MSYRADPDTARRITPTIVEAIAQRVAQLLRAELGSSVRLLTPSQVADRFGVSRSWVYEHADELGVVRLGTGPRARLRFDLFRVVNALGPQTSPGASESDPASVQDPEDLLPVYGRSRPRHSSD